MLIRRLELENIKSYRHLTVDFGRGTTAISGANGAGKTTLVEAIGFALFDYLPYSQAKFVREGEKYGSVTVHLIGNDDRSYEVERRCGSGAQWFVYDREADYRLEQRTDVLDKLHELFGIDRERSLDMLFQDALGVPQGTFTAIFLQTPSMRKRTFDILLQIEDYATAAEYLLQAQKQYKEQMQTQQTEIQRLSYETQTLDTWYSEREEVRLLDREKREQYTQESQQLTHNEEHLITLKQQREQHIQAQHEYERRHMEQTTAQQLLHHSQKTLNEAQTAQQAVVSSQADYQHYQEADKRLQHLRQDEQQRTILRQHHADLRSQLATTEAICTKWHDRLTEVAEARQRIVDLSPLVEQQIALEQQYNELVQKAEQHKHLRARYKELKQEQEKQCQKHKELQQRIAVIELLQPLAAQLSEHNETVRHLHTQRKDRDTITQQLEEKQQYLRQKQQEHKQMAVRLRDVEDTIAQIEAHRSEAEEIVHLQEQRIQCMAQQHRLEGNIDGYKKSHEQSVGGQCPLLHESCLNIKQRGIASLESYFENLLQEEQAQFVEIRQQQQAIDERISEVQQYADALGKLDQYHERRESQAERFAQITTEIAQEEQRVQGLFASSEGLKEIDQKITQAEVAYNESKKAEAQVHQLNALQTQTEQADAQVQEHEARLFACQQEGEKLRGSSEQLSFLEQELKKLNDPRALWRAQQERIKQEPQFQQQLQEAQQQQHALEEQRAALDQQLAAFAHLDTHIAEQEALLRQCLAGYQNYLKNEEVARRLSEREQACQQELQKAEQAEATLLIAERVYKEAETTFSQQELDAVDEAVKVLRANLQALTETMHHCQQKLDDLEKMIQRAEAYLTDLEAARQEHHTLEELTAMMEQFRKWIKEAAPYVLKAMLADISAEANRIFGEVMGDRSAQLSWQNDYEIVLCHRGVNRTFAQLSGGEQMSAALAVRLALLKKLSTLNIAFFDEPTQNMDELRRTNLAEQIRRVRGFDQLIVISHDDTFEQGLDSLIRLQKVDGEACLVDEDDVNSIAGIHMYAS